jgi:hypothetical protein
VSNTKASATGIFQKENKFSETNWCVVSFGSTPEWTPALKRLQSQVLKSNYFRYFEGYTDNWILNYYQESTSVLNFLQQNKRGYGLWFWKPEIMLNTFKAKPEIDGILYIDAGCELNINQASKMRLREYTQLAINKNGLAFELPFKEIEWTEAFVIKEIFPELELNQLQIAGGILFIPNCEESKKILQEWSANNFKKDFSLLRGRSQEFGNIKGNSKVIEHRFDQSIISLIWKRNKLHVIPDETFWHPQWIQHGATYPIWATRSKMRLTFKSNKILFLSYRVLRKLLQVYTRKKIII